MQIFHQSMLGYEFKNLQKKNKQILITLFFCEKQKNTKVEDDRKLKLIF
jgi:hypothetical protein